MKGARITPGIIPRKKYKVTTDWEGKLYIGIALKWDYEKGTVQNSMPGYVRAALHYLQHEKTKRPQESPYYWKQPVYEKNNHMLSEKSPAEELDKNNQKRLQKIVGKFLYYARSIDPKMLMALKSLAAVQKKSTIETTNQITQVLNYSATYPDAITEYIKSGMIIHIYSDVSYISEPEAQSRAGGFVLWQHNPTHRYRRFHQRMEQCM